MRVISEKDIRDLRRAKSVTTAKGDKLKPVLLHKKPKAPLTPEERQSLALEQIVIEIKQVLQANSSNAVILLEMIRKINTDVRLEIPDPATEWLHTITERDSSGKAKHMRSKRVK